LDDALLQIFIEDDQVAYKQVFFDNPEWCRVSGRRAWTA
jgi:hypothetical protein